ncbi:hypothetical protein CEY16_04840 [Halalkalibacillus sediminis]|uniref:Uncharacterized protein n=1 Tax=Halalkalibacillus sediminis TaxID=2018042 RepID=A0A2I0QXM0_9BACI|nr:tetratricopeptide repeat protein [Halalkalibacillus sediminis]PKR79082.1 hypothetical protein CEY16_04840 [Halalkalibacillus sediminis]
MNLIEQGIEYLQEGKMEMAAKVFNDYLEQNPEDPVGYVNFGHLLAKVNESEKAKRFYERALALDETAAIAHYGLGNLYFEEEDFEKATAAYQEAMKAGLDEADVYYMLGRSLMSQEQPKLSLPYLQRASEMVPEDIDIQFQYGLNLAYINMIKEAVEQMKKVIALDEMHSDAHYNLGVGYLHLEEPEPELALKHFEKALEIQPDHVLAGNGKKQVEAALNEE